MEVVSCEYLFLTIYGTQMSMTVPRTKDAVKLKLIEQIVPTLTAIGVIVSAILAYNAAEAARDVKVDLRRTNSEQTEQLTGIAETGEKTHTLVNANMGVQLKLNAVVTQRLATITKDPEDVTAAKLAKQLLVEHEKKQADVDRKANLDEGD